MLDDRKRAILTAIVEEYVSTGLPVGSQTVVRKHSLGISAATVRNEMKFLEQDGYIEQPHTSAGRIPTDLGYRCYAEGAIGSLHLPLGLRRVVEKFFAQAQAETEVLLSETSRLIAKITKHPAVVVGPVPTERTIRGAHIDRLTEQTILVTLVSDTGQVESRRIQLDEVITESQIDEAATFLKSILLARPASVGLKDLLEVEFTQGEMTPISNGVRGMLMEIGHAFEAGEFEGHPPYYFGGVHRTAAEGSFSDKADIRRVLELLEQQAALIRLLQSLAGSDPVAVLIGDEIPLKALCHCTVVATGFGAGGQLLGAIGVVGPTRMDYSTVMSGVAEISYHLGAIFEAELPRRYQKQRLV